MAYIKEWTFSICMACLAAGILQQFSAQRSKASVIKLILSLYILITAFTPLQALRYPQVHLDIPTAAHAEAVDVSAQVAQAAQQSLAKAVEDGCAQQGLSVREIQVTLLQSEDSYTVQSVSLHSESNAQNVSEAVCQILGVQVPVKVQGEK